MKRPEQEEFLKSLKIKKSEIIADNYEELIDKKLTTRVLYDYLIEHQDIMDSTDTEFVEALLLGRDPSRAILNYAVNSKCEERLATLKNKLNVGAITDVNKAFSYAYFYYTNPKYEACCRNTDDLYKLASNLGKANLLEHAVFDYLISNNKLVKNNDKLMCFTFYQNFMANNIKDEPLQLHYFDYNDLMKIMTTQHNNVIEKAEAKAKREKIKEQQDTLDMNNVLDTLSDMTPDRLKTAYPYCAIVRSTYSSGWAQDAFQVTTHYYFTNLSKSEIKTYLKEKGVNIKNTDSGYYNNGTSNHYEWGGTAQGRRTNSYSFVTVNEVPDFKVGEDYEYSSWTAGTMRNNYVHVVAKPKDSGELYHLKARPGKLYFFLDNSRLSEINIFGETVDTHSSLTAFYKEQTETDYHYFALDEFIDEIEKNLNNDEVTFTISCHFYVKYKDIETKLVENRELTDSVLSILNDKYNFKAKDNGYGYFNITIDSSNAKHKFLEYIKEITTAGIDIIIPGDNTNYILARKDESDVYLIKEGTYVTSDTKSHKINKDLFNEVFEK